MQSSLPPLTPAFTFDLHARGIRLQGSAWRAGRRLALVAVGAAEVAAVAVVAAVAAASRVSGSSGGHYDRRCLVEKSHGREANGHGGEGGVGDRGNHLLQRLEGRKGWGGGAE